jgi:probable phosphoglycerate mutase
MRQGALVNGHLQRVFLVRHGETEWNLTGRRQGQLDSPLTDKGYTDAESVARLVQSWSIDAVLSSPRGRARQTALIIADYLGHSAEMLDALAELHHGSLAGLTNREIEERHPGLLREREADKYNWQFPGGESYRDAAVRAQQALQGIGDRGYTRPLLVTHEMIGRMLLSSLLNLNPDDALARDLPHATVLEVRPAEKVLLKHRVT